MGKYKLRGAGVPCRSTCRIQVPPVSPGAQAISGTGFQAKYFSPPVPSGSVILGATSRLNIAFSGTGGLTQVSASVGLDTARAELLGLTNLVGATTGSSFGFMASGSKVLPSLENGYNPAVWLSGSGGTFNLADVSVGDLEVDLLFIPPKSWPVV